jgi:hypothetical protein
MDGGKTHYAGFGGGINFAAVELMSFEPPTGCFNGVNFSMPRGHFSPQHTVVSYRQNLAMANDASAEWTPLPVGTAFAGFLER